MIHAIRRRAVDVAVGKTYPRCELHLAVYARKLIAPSLQNQLHILYFPGY